MQKLRLVMVILHMREGMFRTYGMKVHIEDDLTDPDVQRRIMDVILAQARLNPMMVKDMALASVHEIMMKDVLESQGYKVEEPPENERPVPL